jgi:hypothetical protein
MLKFSHCLDSRPAHRRRLGCQPYAPASLYPQEDLLILSCCWKDKVNVNLSLCLTSWALRHEGVLGSGCIDPCFPDLGTIWKWVVSFTPLPPYSRGKSPRYALNRRLGWPQRRSRRYGQVKILDPTGTRTPIPWVRDHMRWMNFLSSPNPRSRTRPWGLLRL